ncbi:hypothetical protein [Oceanibaculum sp.]|uniref:hypothetical protein n=1 Tax=Oceanibaculum sp. TaxID=1903597 RepID=UPI002584C145|nr:hypothetical protein [Oceanibaculum sp.]MCH2395178.1 hypothetical protein [Oceanibaculum sp.]
MPDSGYTILAIKNPTSSHRVSFREMPKGDLPIVLEDNIIHRSAASADKVSRIIETLKRERYEISKVIDSTGKDVTSEFI